MAATKIYVKKKLLRASATSRIFARFFDYVVNIIFWSIIFFVLQINGFNVYKFFGAVLINVFFSSFYFVFCLWKFKQTLFMFAFKIKIFDDSANKMHFLLKVLRHEFFLTIIYHVALLILSIVFMIIGEASTIKFFQFLFLFNFNTDTEKPEIGEEIPLAIQVFAYFYSAFSFFLFLIIFLIGIFTIYKSKKRTYIDLISWTNTLSLKEVVVKEKSKIKKVNVDMPGVFDDSQILNEEKE